MKTANQQSPIIMNKLLSMLLCLSMLFMLAACSSGKEESKGGAVSIPSQVIFSQEGITVTADRYELNDSELRIYATADNESDKDLDSILGSAYIGGVGTFAYLYFSRSHLSSGEKGLECELSILLDTLSFLGMNKDMIGGEILLVLKGRYSGTTDYIKDTRTLTLPAAKEELPSPETQGLRMFSYCGANGDFSLSYIGEQKKEDGELDLYLCVFNRSDEEMTPTIRFCAVNGIDLSKEQSISSASLIAPGSRAVGILKLPAEDCAACGIESFDDIEYLSYTASGIHYSFDGPAYLLEYRETDAHAADEAVATDRGTIRIAVTKVEERKVSYEIRVDMTTLHDNASMQSLISDIETLTFVNGCGEKFSPSLTTASIDGNDLCYSGNLKVSGVDDQLSLCFLVIGDEVWLLG